MRLNRILLFASLALACLTSCTIETQTHFNKDYSGSQIVTINSGDMMDMVSEMGGGEGDDMDMINRMNDPAFSDTLAMMEDSMSRAFAGTGASNFSFAVSEEGAFSTGFDFKDLETFSRIGERVKERNMMADNENPVAGNEISDMVSGMLGAQVKLDGKWLTINLSQGGGLLDGLKDQMPGGQEMTDEDIEDTMAMMEAFMGGTMIYENTYTFDRNIKKIKTDLPYEQDGNKITVTYSLKKLMNWMKEDQPKTLKVKLK